MHNKSIVFYTQKSCSTLCIIGMSLIELLIVIAILGILAAIVVPSFQNQILQARRGDGISNLLQLKIQQEAYRTENISYASTLKLIMPNSDYFVFSVSNETATSYTITASAVGSQMSDTNCATMSIDQSMHKNPQQCFK